MSLRNRAVFLDRAITGMFCIGLGGVAWMSVFGHRGIAPCLGFMGLFVAFRPQIWRDGLSLLQWETFKNSPVFHALAVFFAFAIWIAVTGLWSPISGAPSLAAGVAVAPLVGGALAWEVSHRPPQWSALMARVFLGAIGIAAVMLCFEALTHGLLRSIVPPEDLSPLRWKDMTSLGRGVTAIVPAVFPVIAIAVGLTRSWIVGAVLFFVAIVAAVGFTISANVLGLMVGGVFFLGALRFPRAVLQAVGALFLASLLFAPLLAALPADAVLSGDIQHLPASWLQRIVVWQAAAERALAECMPLGCGADFARAWGAEDTLLIVPGSPIPLPEMPIHPHNLFLQVWLELGAPGVALLALAIWFGRRASSSLAKTAPAAVIAGLCASAAATLVSFWVEASIWQVWRLAIIGLAALGVALSYSVNRFLVESNGAKSPA